MAKVLVSFDDALLKRLDRAAKSDGETRSAFLAKLAEGEMVRRAGAGRTPAAREALIRLDELFSQAPSDDSTSAVRAARDAR